MKKTVIKTSPYEGQKPGTSGLRKKTKVFIQENYVENFVQATFNAVGLEKLQNATLIVGGDGRFYNTTMIQTIAAMAAANGVGKVTIGQHGLLSTPAVSALIRRHDGGSPIGGFILTASHNPGGKDNDCGIKYNIQNGGPAPESITSKIFEGTKTISEFSTVKEFPTIDLAVVGTKQLSPTFAVEIVDSAAAYVELMKEVFDFDLLKTLIQREGFKFVYDAMHGVAGPYARAIFTDELGIPESCLFNCTPSEDFGGGHPDPNLTYAHDLVKTCGLTSKGEKISGVENVPDMGAAADGDADRNMILGKQFFVTPSDSVAIIAANAAHCIPFFKNQGGLRAVARSMPTSAAADLVAKKMGTAIFQVPTGWKFFGNLMDSGELGGEELNPLICGEESFGTGSNHIREKDGIWAVLCWMSILAFRNKDRSQSEDLVSIEDIVREHWATYGRNYYSRYDYENVDKEKAMAMMAELTNKIESGLAGTELLPGYTLGECDEFEYHDPVDKSVSSNQGWRFNFTDGSRFVFRLSGTGSVGATIRLYLEKYESEESKLSQLTADALSDLVQIALKFSRIEEYTGRKEPTVIT
mmetsp:Transcript_8818/g.11483  ORF Transcript_8818/g.11483 Transcript_8818/m.11483 type:complete len:583 (+) Transcript_8818:107-1855(+)|eukprot:CAMPEP_0184026132 /NCGR_PEP_ID=MMETSP0954-20121128/13312_1 /TAXON_ID=627963 /ORGANISM="Aplanochytrium sp, Strain PBS07" /LENGTH=582 /DNA_ID=CAMNT_0026310225 /DNA_START=88 /DNA_END=1836 /DNA_ORIENTATION=+